MEIDKLKTKLNLLGLQIIDYNDWAVVFKEKTGLLGFNTLDGNYIEARFRTIKLSRKFVICSTEDQASAEYNEVYVKHRKENVINSNESWMINSYSLMHLNKFDILVLISTKERGKLCIINRQGKIVNIRCKFSVFTLVVNRHTTAVGNYYKIYVNTRRPGGSIHDKHVQMIAVVNSELSEVLTGRLVEQIK